MRPQAVGNSGRKRKSGPGIPAMSRCIIRSFRAEIFVCRPGDRSGDGSICGVVFFRFGDEYRDAVAASVGQEHIAGIVVRDADAFGRAVG